MLATIILGSIIAGLFLCHYRIRYTRSGRLIDKIPGPTPIPLFGNILAFLSSEVNIWEDIRLLNKQFFPINRIWAGNYAVININSAEDAEVLLSSTKNITKNIFYDLLHPWFGTGLLTSTGTKWQIRRKLLTPAFHFNILHKYSEIIIEHNDRLIKSMNTKDTVVIDLMPFVTKISLSIICEAAMGVKLHRDENLLLKYMTAVHKFGEISAYRIVRPWLYNNTALNFFPIGFQYRKVLKILRGFSASIIRKRKNYHDQTQDKYLKGLTSESTDDEENVVFGVRKKRLAMLDLLIAANRDNGQIDDNGIQEEVDTFIFEGHDTTSMAMCFALLLIAEHKDIQARAREEVNRVLEENGGKLGINGISKCVYLERCIKESLRLYPSVPHIGRIVEHEITLQGHVVPKGAMCFIHMYDVHRDPKHWKDPLKYNPDRFLQDEIKDRHPYCYIPFSAGPRNCIGQKFAMMELKAFIGTLLHNFYLEAIDCAHTIRLLPDLVIRPGQPMRVNFIPINNKS